MIDFWIYEKLVRINIKGACKISIHWQKSNSLNIFNSYFYLYVNQINFAKGLELEPMHCCHKKVSTHKYQELFWGKVKKEKYLDSTEIRHRFTSGKNLLSFERIVKLLAK